MRRALWRMAAEVLLFIGDRCALLGIACQWKSEEYGGNEER